MSESKISALSPFGHKAFRMLWFATVASNIGTAMHDTGAAWLMTSIGRTPELVALMVTATSLPLVLFALPAGAVSDIFNRRHILIIAQGLMLVLAATMGILTMINAMNPTLLLFLTFGLGIGTAFTMPAMIPTSVSLVSQAEAPAVVTLGGVGINIGRAVGPALGGFVVAAYAPWMVFFLNAVSFVGLIAVLYGLKDSTKQNLLPPERVVGAMRTGLRYIRYSPTVHTVLIRAGVFAICGSAIASLLPLVARMHLQVDSTGYGLLLACFGTGAVASGVLLEPRLQKRLTVESVITIAIGVFSLVTVAVGFVDNFFVLCGVLAVGGIVWIMILSSLNVSAFSSSPKWVGARVLAVYLLVFNVGLASGGILWGKIADFVGIQNALLIAAIGLAAGLITRFRYKLNVIHKSDFTPSLHWPHPPFVIEPAPTDGPVLITIEYKIDPQRTDEFIKAMKQVQKIRLRDGAISWELFGDPTDPSRYMEVGVSESWAEHMRHHERITVKDKDFEDRSREFHIGDKPPVVSHYVAKNLD